jgi:hypothetical protein
MERLLGSCFLKKMGFLLAITPKTAFIKIAPSDLLVQLFNLFLVFAERPAGVCRSHGPPQKTPRLRRRPRGFENLLTGSVGCLCRGALSSGASDHYLSGPAAVATDREEIAAAHADGIPQRNSM